MAAPDYVPVKPQDRPRRAEYMPPAQRWVPERPGDFVLEKAAQPSGTLLGTPGPDPGYALRLATQIRPRVQLQPGEHWEDVEAGCVAVALKRSSSFGRAPVIYDLELALGVFGFLSDSPPADLVEARKLLFESAAHDYARGRSIADGVPDTTLRLKPADVTARLTDWRSLLP